MHFGTNILDVPSVREGNLPNVYKIVKDQLAKLFNQNSLFPGDVSTDSENENPYESLYENPDAIDDIDSFDSDSDGDVDGHLSGRTKNVQVS